MLYIVLIMECFAMWPFPRAHVSMIGFMEKNNDGDGDDDDDDDNSDPVLHDVLYDWFHILYSGNFLSMECNL